MTYQNIRRANVSPSVVRERAVIVARTRPLLDLRVGAALWKDRRVPSGVKLLALSVGGLAIVCLIAVDCLPATLMVGPTAPTQLSLNPVPLSAGSLLFGT